MEERKPVSQMQRLQEAISGEPPELSQSQRTQLRTMAADLRARMAGGEPAGNLVLFTGASGTGKTMAAQVLAGELNREAYRVDMRQVVSKYIGETEKNLSTIFARASQRNAVLFFDEADALFGKRSEVKDSHDRYANLEINSLLEKAKTFPGIVILACNEPVATDHAARILEFDSRQTEPKVPR